MPRHRKGGHRPLGEKELWHLYSLQALPPSRFIKVTEKILSGRYELLPLESRSSGNNDERRITPYQQAIDPTRVMSVGTSADVRIDSVHDVGGDGTVNIKKY